MARLVGFAWEEGDAKAAVSGAPLAAQGGITAYSWPAGKSQQICYPTDSDHHIREISKVLGGPWGHANLTQLAGGTPCRGAMSGYAWKAAGTKQVAYVGDGGHIHEM